MNRVNCSMCGKPVSNPVSGEIVVRAFVECPECINHDRKLNDKPMVWHKLADEKPVEAGQYLIIFSDKQADVRDVTIPANSAKHWAKIDVTHWMLITPPEREGE